MQNALPEHTPELDSLRALKNQMQIAKIEVDKRAKLIREGNTTLRTFVSFSQFGNRIEITYNGNKLQALNRIKQLFSIREVHALTEYRVEEYRPQGQYTIDN